MSNTTVTTATLSRLHKKNWNIEIATCLQPLLLMTVILSEGRRGDRSRKLALSAVEGDLHMLFAHTCLNHGSAPSVRRGFGQFVCLMLLEFVERRAIAAQ